MSANAMKTTVRAGGTAARCSRVAPFVYTGIQIVSKALLRDSPEGAFSTNLLWDRAIAAGRCYGAVHQGLWFDVGTPEVLQDMIWYPTRRPVTPTDAMSCWAMTGLAT